MNKSLCAHCKNCKEVKYDGFLCDCTGYLEDKTTSTGCDMFENDGFSNSKTNNKEENTMNNMSDIIATMALNGATKEELNRAIEYSAAVIQLEKMRDAKGIDELKKKYCTYSPVVCKPKTFEEETGIMDCFFDKYESLIQAAPRNSLLGMIRDLNDAVMGIAAHQVDVDHLSKESENDENLKTAEACITHVAVLLAQMWADENEDIELSCADPATGEETIINGKEEKENG